MLLALNTIPFPDLALGNPEVWDMVLEEMPTLRPRQWLGGKILDFILLSHWAQVYREAPVLFVDVETSRYFAETPDLHSDQVIHTRKRLLLPDPDALEEKPVLVPIMHINHYFLVLFDYTNATAHIIGQRYNVLNVQYTRNVDWTEWDGDRLWEHIAQIMGWAACPVEDVEIFGVDWPQVYFNLCLLVT